MTEDQFKALCNTYGFAPSRALRDMLDKVAEMESESCAKVVEGYCGAWYDEGFALVSSIRARSSK